MKISRNKEVEFCTVKSAELFLYEGTYYIKIEPQLVFHDDFRDEDIFVDADTSANAVCIDCGRLAYFDCGEMVTPYPNATIKLEGE